MVMRPLSRLRTAVLLAGMVAGFLSAVPGLVAAAPIDKEGCDRLEMERKALLVLGIDRYFENGIEWARANLTVADLNLVKRYLDVYERLKFQCKEEVEIVGSDLQGEVSDDETIADELSPPLPVRKPVEARKASMLTEADQTVRVKVQSGSGKSNRLN
ncbi:MAG: hypothetical protein ACFCUR_11775 [Rhodomicrobiaceae bacterium]